MDNQKFDHKFKCQLSQSYKVLYFPDTILLKELKPLVIVAHGTGITPFISILTRMKNVLELSSGTLSSISVFYGTRNDLEEFLYKEDFDHLFDKPLFHHVKESQMYLACSRDLQETPIEEAPYLIKRKGYVQDFFKEADISKKLRE